MSVPTSSPASVPSPMEALNHLERALNEAIPGLIMQARTAWRRDLPMLLKKHPGQWIAYHGEKQIGIGQNKKELFQKCLREGLQRGEILVLRIEPETDHNITVPVDV